MTDDKIETEREEARPNMRLRFTEDGDGVRMEFDDDRGGTNVVTMPLTTFADFHRAVSDVLQKARAAGRLPNAIRVPAAWRVGNLNDPSRANFTVVMFDQDTAAEMSFMLESKDAIALADGIERNVFKKLTPEERAQVEALRRKSAPKIILPGQVRQ